MIVRYNDHYKYTVIIVSATIILPTHQGRQLAATDVQTSVLDQVQRSGCGIWLRGFWIKRKKRKKIGLRPARTRNWPVDSVGFTEIPDFATRSYPIHNVH